MKKDILTKLINKNYSIRQIANELVISYTTIRYWLKKFNLKTNTTAKRSWTDKEMAIAIKTSVTYVDVLKKLKLTNRNGNRENIHKFIKDFDIDTSHMKGNKAARGGKKRATKEILIKHSKSTRATLVRRIKQENLIPYVCANCKQSPPMWKEKPLPLDLDHINGVSNDNRLENLRFLCPNCHRQTKTHSKQK